MKNKDRKPILKADKKLTKSIDSLFKCREFLIDNGISKKKIATVLFNMTLLSLDFGVVIAKNGYEVEK